MSCEDTNLGCVLVGSDFMINFTATNPDGTPTDLSGAIANPGSPVPFGIVVTATAPGVSLGPYAVGSGVTITGPGAASVAVPKEAIAAITAPKKVRFRVLLTDPVTTNDQVQILGYVTVAP